MDETVGYQEDHVVPHGSAYVIVGSLYCCMTLLVGSCGHLAVIIVTCCNKEMKSTSSAYFVSVSVAHLLMLVTAALPEVVRYHVPSAASNGASLVWSSIMFLQNLCSIATILSMSLLSVERCVTWCCYKPPHCVRSLMLRRTGTAIAAIWLTSVVCAAPWIHFLVYFDKRANADVDVDAEALDSLEQRMQLVLACADALAWYVVPLALISTNCIIIYRRIATTNETQDGSQNTLALGNQLCFVSDSWIKTRASLKKSRCQLAKTLTVVSVLYALCWLPFRIWVVCNAAGPAEDLAQLDPWLTLFVRLLIYANAAAAPLVYCSFSYKFRRAFKLLFVKLAKLLVTCCRPHNELRAGLKSGAIRAAGESPDMLFDQTELVTRNSISDASEHMTVRQHNSNESVHMSITSASRLQKY